MIYLLQLFLQLDVHDNSLCFTKVISSWPFRHLGLKTQPHSDLDILFHLDSTLFSSKCAEKSRLDVKRKSGFMIEGRKEQYKQRRLGVSLSCCSWRSGLCFHLHLVLHAQIWQCCYTQIYQQQFTSHLVRFQLVRKSTRMFLGVQLFRRSNEQPIERQDRQGRHDITTDLKKDLPFVLKKYLVFFLLYLH